MQSRLDATTEMYRSLAHQHKALVRHGCCGGIGMVTGMMNLHLVRILNATEKNFLGTVTNQRNSH